MKSILILLIVSLRLGAEDIKVYCIGWSESHSKGQTLHQTPREELEKIPAWDPADGQRAPLTREQAVGIALKAAAAQGLSLSDDPRIVVSLEKIHPSYLTETRDHPIRGCLWFYVVKVMGEAEKLPGENAFVVTMSGALCSRKIQQTR